MKHQKEPFGNSFRNTLRNTALVFTSLALFGPAWAKDADMARIITGIENPPKCISKVQVNNIDGKEVRVPAAGFDLEPGSRTLAGRAIINTAFCPALGYSDPAEKVEPLVADFEAGKTYYVGYDHSSSDRKEWGLKIWKVKGDD